MGNSPRKIRVPPIQIACCQSEIHGGDNSQPDDDVDHQEEEVNSTEVVNDSIVENNELKFTEVVNDGIVGEK